MDSGAGIIQWRGRLDGHSGYAVEGRSFIRALREAGYCVLEVPVPSPPEPEVTPLREDPSLPRPGMTIVHLPWHDRGWDNLAGTVVWRAMFETASVPPEWAERLASVDEVWVPSRFNARTFASAGVPGGKLKVIPEFVEPEWLELSAARYTGQGRFRFLSVFRWQERKGWDVLLKAYLTEFTADDDVELILRVDPLGRGATDIASIIGTLARSMRLPRPPRLLLLSHALPLPELRRLYAGSHAFVLPTRGEAWGRTFMEAMACGMITIGTGWGGHLDFMNSSNSLLVDWEPVKVSESASREWPYFRGQIWAEPSIESLRRCMRRAVDGGPDIERLRHEAASSIARTYCRDKVHEVLLEQARRLATPSSAASSAGPVPPSNC